MWVSLVLGLLVHVDVAAGAGCHKPAGHVEEHVLSPRSHELVGASSLPLQFDWRNVSGISWVTAVRNQQLPRLCGSCWAMGATSALSDRFYYATRGSTSGALLSPQVLLDLSDLPPHAGSCNGGDHRSAYSFIHKYGIADESCNPYLGVDSATWGEDVSTNARMCRVCTWDGTCRFTEGGPRYRILEHGSVLGPSQMMAEIFHRGPIACAVHARGTVFNTYTGLPEVMQDDTVYNETTHIVEIIGWGETSDGRKYWTGKNSYGTLWGLRGFFKLRRGYNDLALENHQCAWAVPDVRTGTIDSDTPSVEAAILYS